MIRILISIPLLIILIAFALSNQQMVRLGLWPTDILVDVPLSVAVLIAAGIFFVVGAFLTWTTAVAMRSRARRAERQARDLRAQVDTLRQQQRDLERSAERGVVSQARSVALLPPG